MSGITIIKKIGEKIISIVEWPFKHSAMLVELLAKLDNDAPATKSALVGFVQQCEALGPDALGAIAAKGLDIPDDMKVGADVKSLFTYIQQTLLPTIEKDYADLKASESATGQGSSPAPPVAGAPAPGEAAVVEGPGLHNVVPA
jgi:hypothetical protein